MHTAQILPHFDELATHEINTCMSMYEFHFGCILLRIIIKQ